MKLKKFGAVLMATCILSTSFVGNAFAATPNTKDTSFSFTLSSSVKTTSRRTKVNSTGTYVYVKSSPSGGCNYRVYGSRTSSSVGINTTAHSYAVIYSGSKRKISQYVYEQGFKYAALGVQSKSSSQNGKTVKGVWSPDSVGNYAYAN